MDRLKKICSKHNYEFEHFHTHASPIDCIINKNNIQCKTSSKKGKTSFSFSIQKHKGRTEYQPYSDKDGIDFFIFEQIGDENNFYVIPINVLIERNYINTDIYEGRRHISIPKPNSPKQHWTKKYLNRFDLLK